MEEKEEEVLQAGAVNEVRLFPTRKFRVSTFMGLLVLVVGLATGVIVIQREEATRVNIPAAGLPLSTVKTNTGLSAIIYGLAQYSTIYKEADLTVSQPITGVYEIKRTQGNFPCTPGTKHPDGSDCEPDRFEIRFNSVIPHIYGLGFVTGANQVELSDFLDVNFSFSHCVTPRDHNPAPTPAPIDFWVTDICRMRTPMMVFPQQGMIIAYLQPYVKALRLTRNGQYGCPTGSTCIVMKKRMDYSDGTPAPFVIIKKKNITEAYTAYRNYLKDQKGFFYKEPHYKAYGVNWEIWGELNYSQVSKNNIMNIINNYYNGVADPYKKILISSVTVGGGYWGDVTYGGKTCVTSCVFNPGISCGGCPATDALAQNTSKFPGGLPSYYDGLTAMGIYPLIGMRQRIQTGEYTPNWVSSAPVPKNAIPTTTVPYVVPESTLKFDNRSRIAGLLQGKGATGDLFWKSVTVPGSDSLFHHIESAIGMTNWYYLTGFYMLNTYNTSVVNAWIDLLKQNYGNFKGIKNDDMLGSDQKYIQGQFFGQQQGNLATNPPDNIASKVFPQYDSQFNKDILIFSRDDWMSPGTDGQYASWHGRSRWNGGIEYADWESKLYVDSALTQVVSGYPNPNLGGIDTSDTEIELMRNYQLNAFFPFSDQAYGYWHIANADKKNTAIFYSKLRNRLHKYAYDQAMKAYETGIPTLMRPLFIDYPNDSEVYKLYEYAGPHPEPNKPTNEFMFGNAILIRPIFADVSTFKTYLPSGNWKAFMHTTAQGNSYTGGQTISYSLLNTNDYPIFLKEGEILIIGGYPEASVLGAYVYMKDLTQSNTYKYYVVSGEKHASGNMILRADKSGETVTLKNISNGKSAVMVNDPYAKGFKYIANISSIL